MHARFSDMDVVAGGDDLAPSKAASYIQLARTLTGHWKPAALVMHEILLLNDS